MPRAGLTPEAVVAAGAELADEVGYADATLTRLAERVGVRAPSLYKHVAGQSDLNRGIAALALREAADAIGVATQGRAGRDALAAAARALRQFVVRHPGRYAATIGVSPVDADDPVATAEARALGSFAAVLRGYDLDPDDMTHALRALRSVFHGFATLEASRGFQWGTDVDESFEWLVALVHHGLQGMSAQEPAGP